MANRQKSFETVLEEERREVLALLEKRPSRRPKRAGGSTTQRRASSPLRSMQRPVRSMIDVESGPTSQQASKTLQTSKALAAAAKVRASGSDGPQSVLSMLDMDSTTPDTSDPENSSPSAAERQAKGNQLHHRSLSDTTFRPSDLEPFDADFILSSAYKLSGYLSSNPGPPKYNTPEITKTNSHSPQSSLTNLDSDSDKLFLTDGTTINKNSAYHRLSDTNLTVSGHRSSLSSANSSRRASSGDATKSYRPVLKKGHLGPEDEEAVAESSEEEDRSSDEERHRGRKKEPIGKARRPGKSPAMRASSGPKSALGRAAAAGRDGSEDTKQEQYTIRSRREPEITITEPQGDKLRSSRRPIHPHTSFDELASGFNTPVDSDAEADLTDIKRAQKLSVNMTSIVSTPATGRCVRTIYRGDFAKMQQEAHDNQRRVRKYLVATDLSEEAAHALEWTIGTVLRDGDTLLAIYCVDEELGISSNEPPADDAQLHAAAAAVATTNKTSIPMPALPSVLTSPLGSAFKLESSSANASPMGRGKGKAEHERFRAVQDITDRVSKLLRRTKLQVKVVIEVIHCKSPKHLITEIIDYLSPTLVILGSRGRSALKGVILGSFSNYLVTKSSVPVMVARKRLRKHSKYKRPAIRLANNLAANPAVRGLATAKID